MKQTRKQFTIICLGIIVAIAALVASIVTYVNAYFTANADKKGNLDFHNIELELDTDGVDSFSMNLTELSPGDTLELTDVSVKNVGTAELYAIINLNIYITRPGYTDYNVDYWKDLEGNDVNISDLNSNTVGATKVALNGSKALNLSHTFDGAIFDNSFKNATAKITLNAYGIQTTHLEPIGSISDENLIATKMLVDENYSFKAQNVVDYDQFDEVDSLSCTTASTIISEEGMYGYFYNIDIINAKNNDDVYVSILNAERVALISGHYDLGSLMGGELELADYEEFEGYTEKKYTITSEFEGFDVFAITTGDKIPEIEIGINPRGMTLDDGKIVYAIDCADIEAENSSFSLPVYTVDASSLMGEGVYADVYNFKVTNTKYESVTATVSSSVGVIIDNNNYTKNQVKTMIETGSPPETAIVYEFTDMPIPMGHTYELTPGEDFEICVMIMRITGLPEYTVELTVLPCYEVDYADIDSQTLSFDAPTEVCDITELAENEIYLDIYNFNIQNPTKDDVVTISINQGMMALIAPNFNGASAEVLTLFLTENFAEGSIVFEKDTPSILTGALEISAGENYRFCVVVIRMPGVTPENYTVETTCGTPSETIDYAYLKAQEPLTIQSPTYSIESSFNASFAAKDFNFTIENITEDRTVMVTVMGYMSMTTEKHTTFAEFTQIDANLIEYTDTGDFIGDYRVGSSLSSELVFSFNLKKGEDFAFSILDWNPINNGTTMITMYFTPTEDLPYVYHDIPYIPLEDGSGYATMPQEINRGLNTIIIKDYINGLPVKEIAKGAFSATTTSTTIPSTVETIGSNAFSDSDNLTELNLQAKSEYIWVEVDLSGKIVADLSSLSEQELISKLQAGHSELRQVFNGDNPVYTLSNDGTCYSLINVPRSITNFSIPSEYEGKPVKEIQRGAFMLCSNLTSVTFGDNSQLTTIGSEAFYYCENLTSIEIPSSVTTIGYGAFYRCDKLTSVTFGDNSQLTTIGSEAFYYCENLTSIEIPSSVTTIGYGAFYDCGKLTSVTFEENSQLTTIGSYAFFSCSKLTSIEIPNSVTMIGSYAFSGCSNLTSIEIPSSVTTIGSYAFFSCSKLTSIEIPSSVTTIGDGAFYDCSNLTTLTLQAKENYKWQVNVNSAWVDCSTLTDAQILQYAKSRQFRQVAI